MTGPDRTGGTPAGGDGASVIPRAPRPGRSGVCRWRPATCRPPPASWARCSKWAARTYSR
jgi:hypothetical protein